MKEYHHLTQRERYLIEFHLSRGKTQKDTAYLLGISPSTVCREIQRNKHKAPYKKVATYDYLYADYKARMRVEHKPKRSCFTPKIETYIRRKLNLEFSPEQIQGVMQKDINERISIERIYKYVYDEKRDGGSLYTHLRWQNKKRKRRLHGRSKTRVFGDTPRKSIHDRAAIIEEKIRFGDLEIDTIIGKNHKQAILTITDRKTKYLWMQKLIFKRAESVSQATNRLLKSLKGNIHTITADNGSEFAKYQSIEKSLDIEFYFCDPYASWQRGLNEHTNGLIRQYLPKKTDFTTVSYNQIKMIKDRINNRPRKVLGFKTPKEALAECFEDI
jgi:transposase, IS30 family